VGTPLAEIAQALAEHGQAMAFDPPLVDAGATLGGAIAAGLSGPGRVRFGGLRDFLLGVTFVDGKGDVVHGGGRVVKNAAGLDFARMLVGSAGRLGILTEATFKVFPSPPAFGTVRIPVESMAAGAALLARLNALPLEYYGVELAADEPALYARLGGLEQVLPARLAQITSALGGEQLAAPDEAAFWRDARELAWAQSDGLLLRIATLPHRVAAWEASPLVQQAQRRYSAGGHILWARFPAGSAVADIERLLVSEGTAAVAVRGAAPHPILGKRTGLPFLGALRTVFDPTNRFFEL
jgi:glycolate oxidase FAD binding subunit